MVSSGMLRRVALVAHFVFLPSVRRLLVTANVVPSSPILVTLTMEALISAETSVITRAIRRNIADDGILHILRRENLRSKLYTFVSPLPHSCSMSRPPHSPRLYNSNYTWRRVHINEASRYAVFSILPSLHPTLVQIFSSAPCLQTSLVYSTHHTEVNVK
jgi:hypothetical protein